ncbi:hypothetical protein POM88_051327 [Heracleum sosnowskyi]|uniref:Helitron helicase-like domain-containing protein n=1 Tax=Heracleum sosnowskyi TaxID=360622 RepID=A0AAD8H0A2_9APIA|nr:hypothetical protein POM88_051327 [Heracleum sosnowskyi]
MNKLENQTDVPHNTNLLEAFNSVAVDSDVSPSDVTFSNSIPRNARNTATTTPTTQPLFPKFQLPPLTFHSSSNFKNCNISTSKSAFDTRGKSSIFKLPASTILPKNQVKSSEQGESSDSHCRNLLNAFNHATKEIDMTTSDPNHSDVDDVEFIASDYLSDDNEYGAEVPTEGGRPVKVPDPYDESDETKHRVFVSLREYYAYKLMIRPSEALTPHLCGRLWKQYIVDAFTAVEQYRLDWVKTHQTTIRADLYSSIRDSLRKDDRPKNIEDIDKLVSAEIPDKDSDPICYNAVKNYMVHGPCGKDYSYSPCIANGKCIRHFPKRYNGHTFFDDSAMSEDILYSRRKKTGNQALAMTTYEIENYALAEFEKLLNERRRAENLSNTKHIK